MWVEEIEGEDFWKTWSNWETERVRIEAKVKRVRKPPKGVL